MVKSHRERLVKALKKLGATRNKAQDVYAEFDRTSYTASKSTTCLCGKRNLKRTFGIRHRKTKKAGILGSRCINKIKHKKGYHSVLKQ